MLDVSERMCAMLCLVAVLGLAGQSHTAAAERRSDPIAQQMWADPEDGSELVPLADVLVDSIGARMTGSPQDLAAHDWLRRLYERRGFTVRTEAYDSLPHQWNRGLTHVDLLTPRLRTLEANLYNYSPGTRGKNVDGPVIAIPDTLTSAKKFEAWLSSVRGSYVLLSFARPVCREYVHWESFATPVVRARLESVWEEAFRSWRNSVGKSGVPFVELPMLLERAGALGVLVDSPIANYERLSYVTLWKSYRPGAMHDVTNARTARIPLINLSCEDYGLISRLVRNGPQPRLRVNSTASFGRPAPVLHTVAILRGAARPEEYVVIGEHLDSKDSASGATDNGTGTLAAIEAMRLLQAYYVRPRRTIVAHHWSGEEQGLSWNPWFTGDAAAVSEKIQVTIAQDSGTGRTVHFSLNGPPPFARAWARWLEALPQDALAAIESQTEHIQQSRTLVYPGARGCVSVPEVTLLSFRGAGGNARRWNYSYTYHGNRDTYDKIVFTDVEHNAKLIAMLAYLAAEDPTFVPAAARDEGATPMPCREGAPRVDSLKHPAPPQSRANHAR